MAYEVEEDIMRSLILVLLSVFSFLGSAQAGNYILTVDGKLYDVNLGEEISVPMDDGSFIKVRVDQKDYVAFQTDNYSFEHPSGFSPARTDLGDGIFQTMIATPTGALVLVQEYMSMDPYGMVDMMIHELTKEEVEYGYKLTETGERMTINGQMFTGKKVMSEYKGEVTERYVMTYSGRDSGLLIITNLNDIHNAKDIELIEHFWQSINVTMR